MARLRFDINQFGIGMLLSLVLVTILSLIVSEYSDIPVLKTGGAFMLILISVFLIYLFVIVKDGKFDKSEIFTMVMVAVALAGAGWALKTYFPEIFSAFPQSTREVFSAIGQ